MVENSQKTNLKGMLSLLINVNILSFYSITNTTTKYYYKINVPIKRKLSVFFSSLLVFINSVHKVSTKLVFYWFPYVTSVENSVSMMSILDEIGTSFHPVIKKMFTKKKNIMVKLIVPNDRNLNSDIASTFFNAYFYQQLFFTDIIRHCW